MPDRSGRIAAFLRSAVNVLALGVVIFVVVPAVVMALGGE